MVGNGRDVVLVAKILPENGHTVEIGEALHAATRHDKGVWS